MTRDELLDKLFDRLAGTGGTGRRALAEAEDHLEDAVADARTQGLDPTAAEALAVARFGSPDEVAAAVRGAHRPGLAMLRPVLLGLWLAGVVVGLAAGVSGLIAEFMGRLSSPELVAGDRNGVTYTAARCAEYLHLAPGARDCAQAAAIDHWGELAMGREGAGVLGLLGLGAWLLARRTALRGAQWVLPVPVVTAVLTVAFAAGAVLLGGQAVADAALFSTTGTGMGLADGSVCAVAALVCALWTARRPLR
jgi:hypothetical protein